MFYLQSRRLPTTVALTQRTRRLSISVDLGNRRRVRTTRNLYVISLIRTPHFPPGTDSGVSSSDHLTLDPERESDSFEDKKRRVVRKVLFLHSLLLPFSPSFHSFLLLFVFRRLCSHLVITDGDYLRTPGRRCRTFINPVSG